MFRAIITLFCLMLIAGCSSEVKVIEDEEKQQLVSSNLELDEDSIHYRILMSEIEFVDLPSDMSIVLDEINYDGYVRKPLGYALIDLNHDGNLELVVDSIIGAADFSLIFISYDDDIYCHQLSEKQFSQLKTDGSFSVSGGAGEWGVYQMEFENENYTLSSICTVSTDTDDDEKLHLYEMYNGEITADEFNEFMELHKLKESVVWNSIPDK